MSAVNLGDVPVVGALRDAVHVAVVPAVAGCLLEPGDRVELIAASKRGELPEATLADPATAIGIADPFGTRVIRGGRLWVLILPSLAVTLRHDWIAPGVPSDPSGDLDDDEYDECRGCNS